MEAEGAQGLIWSLTIVVMPILLGLAIAYGAYRREPGRTDARKRRC